MSRPRLLTQAKERFGLGQRGLDDQVAEFRSFLKQHRDGHTKVFEIDWDAVRPQNDEEDLDEQEWRQLVRKPEAG